MPVPPQVEDPKNVIFVTPSEPKVITVAEIVDQPRAPNTPIVVVIEPKYGEIQASPTGNFIYTSNIEDPTSIVVDVVGFRYTNLSGAAVVVRKEIVLAQQGDIPRIVQTGGSNPVQDENNNFALFVVLAVAIAAFVVRRNRRNNA